MLNKSVSKMFRVYPHIHIAYKWSVAWIQHFPWLSCDMEHSGIELVFLLVTKAMLLLFTADYCILYCCIHSKKANIEMNRSHTLMSIFHCKTNIELKWATLWISYWFVTAEVKEKSVVGFGNCCGNFMANGNPANSASWAQIITKNPVFKTCRFCVKQQEAGLDIWN